MRHFFITACFAIALAFGIAQPANAQLMQIAICVEGGCTCHVTSQTLADFEMTMGVPAPAGAADKTLVTYNGEYSWRSETPAQIDASFGGPGDCPVQLEPPLIPEDGLWRITAGATDTSACPLFAMTGQTLPGQMSGDTRQIKWKGWFQPSTLMSEAAGLVRWTWAGGHTWRGVLADERLSGGGGMTGASVVWQLSLVSPTEISGSSVFEYDISSSEADAAALAVLAKMQCRTVTPFTARKVG